MSTPDAIWCQNQSCRAVDYRAEVHRNDHETTGPGKFRLYRGKELLREWDCITGGDQLDSREYGGLAPEITWVMTQEIKLNDHPKKDPMVMSIIQPFGGGKTFFPKRTLHGEDGYPFMLHIAGSSTGCIAIQSNQWDDFKSCMNAAFAAESFPITVYNIQPE